MSAAGRSLARAGSAALCLALAISGPASAQESSGGVARLNVHASDTAATADSTTAARTALDLVPGLLLTDDSHAIEPAEAQKVDAWGVKKNWGLAVGEVIAVNNIVWFFNEYIRGANFTQVNPRSWYENVFVEGFTYDDNHFNTNMFAHPYHGSMYYTSARSNGFNYWASVPFAIGGSFMWECCGETHPPAINDWIMTGIGGAAIGETFYRLSGTVLDNTATGSERTWREIGALLISPVRGFNRLVSGRWSEVGPNPNERMPSSMSNQLSVGVRVIGEGKSIDENTTTNAFLEVDYSFGSPFSSQNRKPFDFFNMGLQLNTNEKHGLGRLQIQGNLLTKDLKVTEKVHHVFSVTQDYDYINNFAYEFGGQSVAASLKSHWNLSENWLLRTDVSLYGMLMGAVNSNFAFVAQFGPGFEQERLREYDFGTGGGPALGAALTLKGRDVLAIRWRMTYLYTLNGSVIAENDNSHHFVQWLIVRGRVPISHGFGLGADAGVFLRDSYYSCEVCDPDYIQQRNPQLRLYGVWQVGREGF